MPYLLAYGKRGKLECEAEGGVFCGDGDGDCMSALALKEYLAHNRGIWELAGKQRTFALHRSRETLEPAQLRISVAKRFGLGSSC